jgi:hypothetical protein
VTAAVKPLWKQVAPRTDLWMPPGTTQEESVFMGRSNPDLDNDVAFAHKFTFKYKGKRKTVTVLSQGSDSKAEIEDKAADAADRWKAELDQQEHKRAPTQDEIKDIGKALNDIYLHREKRRESSTGKIYH